MQVAFDLGQVLVKVDDSNFGYAYHSICKTTQDYIIFLDAIQKLQDTGLVTIKQALRNKFGNSILPYEDQLIKAWNNNIRPHDKMMKFLEYLKSQSVEIGILSNIGIYHAAAMRTKYPEVFAGCKSIHLSCEVGVRKPSRLFFQSFLWDNYEFNGCPYIDDLPENLAMGSRCGFEPINFNINKFDMMTKAGQEKELDKIKSAVFNRVLTLMPG